MCAHPRPAEAGAGSAPAPARALPTPPTDVVVLDRASPVPLWYQIATQLAAAIQARDLPGGSSLPERAELARRWRVCHATVHHALEMLVAHGLVVRPRPGVYLVRP